MNTKGRDHRKRMAVLAVVLTLAVLFAPMASFDESDAADETYTYTISSSGAISGGYTPIANNSSASGKYTSSNGTSNVGSWGFDSDGYGPFNSYYAAFDPENNNEIVCHLNPNNLMKSVDGTIDITGKDYNIMWVLPTVYWKTSGTDLILTNDATAGGTAYAHTVYVDGVKTVYPYLAIGVYEASTLSVNGTTILTSISGDTPLVSQTRATFRDYANNQTVNTAGEGVNGHAMVWNFYQYELYKYCALAVMGGWDSQGIAGNGSSYGGSPYYDTPGLLNTSGPYAGTKGSNTSESYTADPVKVFIENAWGSVYDFVDGVVINGRSGYTIDQNVIPTDSTSTTTSGSITYVSQALPSSSGYGSSPATNVNVWGMPTANSGSATSGLYDYVYTSSSTSRVLFVGGYSYNYVSNAPYYGLSSVDANNALSTSTSAIGGRLAFVFADDPAATPTVTLDHSDLAALMSAEGDTTNIISNLQTKIKLESEGMTYPTLSLPETNYTFLGWSTANDDTAEIPAGTTITNMTSHKVYSIWTTLGVLTFDYSALTAAGADESLVAPLDDTMTIQLDGSSTYPKLNLSEYNHVGWYIDGVFVAPNTQITNLNSHTAYIAVQQPMITITFMVEGTVNGTLEIPKNTVGIVYTPENVTGVFMGWYYDGAYTNKYTATQPFTEDSTLYAKGVRPLEFTSTPVASATITNVDAHGLVYFDATDSTGRSSVLWDFGDGNTSTDPIAYNSYAEPGTYTVTLTVTNAHGLSDVRTYSVSTGEVPSDDATGDDDGWGIGAYAAIVIALALAGYVVARRFL